MQTLTRVPLILILFVYALWTLQSEQPVTSRTRMDWRTEQIYSTLSLDTKKSGIQLPAGRTSATRILEMETPGLLKDVFFSVVVNSSMKLGHAVEAGMVSLSDLDRILSEGKKTPPWISADLHTMYMNHTVSIARVGSLFVTHRSAWEQRAPLEVIPTRAYTGILIDARGPLPVQGEYTRERLMPALFPRVWNTAMDLLYERNMVEPAIAVSRGIVRYTASTDEQSYRDIIGNDPLRIIARGVFGNNRTDPVISREDYLRILSHENNRTLLREGKLVILCDSEALEPSPLGPDRSEGYYFVRQEIERELKKQPVRRIDFSDDWDGLKMVIYDIRFVADSAEILDEEKDRLDVIAAALRSAGNNARFVIEGHTAQVGKPAGERQLSIERAQRIARELVNRGIASGSIQTAGFGGERPVATNDTAEGRSLNRRVEITITPGN